ncbi:MAG: ribose 5-phosphate isomerase B [Deltaproteobacteria bacterium]|nr:ribose 5-phosphate isomerase B [Deltaproteobacteria bacterium]
MGSDHAGFDLKQSLATALKEAGYEIHDVGTHQKERCDYPDFSHALAETLLAKTLVDEKCFGILVCGSGMGVSIAANRHAGIRAVNCSFESQAVLSRAHNDANVLCLGQRVVAESLATSIAFAFLTSPFEGGRHTGRVEKIEL